jgi:hypothetical protein
MIFFVYDQFVSAVVSQQLSAAPDFLDAANNQLKLLAGQMNSNGLPAECVLLRSPYSGDTTGYGVVHPYHRNECLAISNPDLYADVPSANPVFVIFDCYGDIYCYPDIRDALTEFTHPAGHTLWEDVMESGQGRKDYYFMQVPALTV